MFFFFFKLSLGGSKRALMAFPFRWKINKS
jgi:hypothetical protein